MNPAQAMNAARQLEEKQQLSEAEHIYRRIIETDPRFHPAYHSLGILAYRVGKLPLASELMGSAIALDQNVSLYHQNRGEICRRLGHTDQAVAHSRKAISLNPSNAEAHYNLGLALADKEVFQEAVDCYRKAISINPRHGQAWNNLGSALENLDEEVEAETAYRKALEINKDHMEAQSNLGRMLSKKGQLTEARELLNRSLDLNPKSIESHYALSSLKRYTADDPHVQALQELAKHTDGLSEKEHIQLNFTLGKMNEDLGEFETAFPAFARGNALRKSQLKVDEGQWEKQSRLIREKFTTDFLAGFQGTGIDDAAPVFIVGMPRSGTSLIEQILDSHSAVFGAGELKDFHTLAREILKVKDDKSYVQYLDGIDRSAYATLGQQYVDRVRQLSPDTLRITDKMPANFFYLGLIRLALPNAKIIHSARDPMDSCLSCYCRYFNDTMDFSYDLRTLGLYYQSYHQLMTHWEKVLPPGSILTVRYEDMVADVEGQTRRMLDFLELPWEDGCLEYYNNERPVKTASLAQVRRPIYKNSVQGWKRYEQQLQPLLELVRDIR